MTLEENIKKWIILDNSIKELTNRVREAREKRENINKPADPIMHEIEYNFLASNVSFKLTKKGVATTYPI